MVVLLTLTAVVGLLPLWGPALYYFIYFMDEIMEDACNDNC